MGHENGEHVIVGKKQKENERENSVHLTGNENFQKVAEFVVLS
jgi:hypothetical protein